MNLEQEIKDLQKDKRNEVIGLGIKTGLAFYVFNEAKEFMNFYNKNYPLIEKTSLKALESEADNLYLTKGLLWLDQKVSSTYRMIRGVELPEKPEVFPKPYVEGFPYIATALFFALSLRKAKKNIRNIKRMQYLLK